MRSPASLILYALMLSPLAACQEEASLEGDWEGELDCDGAGSPGMEIEVDETDDFEYEGLGRVEGLVLDGVETGIAFRWEFVQGLKWGSQVLDVSAECYAEPVDGTAYELDCSDVQEMGWDGADTMGADIEDFLSTGIDCELELER